VAGSLDEGLRERIAAAHWYHVLELPGGIVTRGEYDLRKAARRSPLPASLAGMRCLDVGTRDGFWAFEMERRGADVVVGIDIDDPLRYDWPQPAPSFTDEHRDELEKRSSTFAIAHEALGSSVERRDLSVYDLDPGEVGRFDVAVLGTLLLHLRDPVAALSAVRGVLAPGGALYLNEAISIWLTLVQPRTPVEELIELWGPYWTLPNVAALRERARKAGFTVERISRPYVIPHGPGIELPPLRPRRDVRLRQQLSTRLGMPHVWLAARSA
jgi:tRNA (mo5U34)-methyltransferase